MNKKIDWEKQMKVRKGFLLPLGKHILRTFIILIILFLIELLLIEMLLIYSEFDYVNKDIDEIIYAEPTEEAKNFDFEAHINNLPSMKYEKVNYPVKERYAYEFNDYVMTIDIPKGFSVNIIEHDTRRVVVKSKSIDDSYEPGLGKGPATDTWNDAKVISDNILCIVNDELKSDGFWCSGFSVVPEKSRYRGVSIRDINLRMDTNSSEDYLKHSTGRNDFKIDARSYYKALLFLSDQQNVRVNVGMNFFGSEHFSRDLYLSVLDSIEVKKK